MVYILAAIGAITVAVLLWQAFGSQAVEAATRSGNSSQPVAPDDDPEFLRKLGEDQRKRRNDEN